MAPQKQSVALFGASTGIALAILKQSIADGHECIALCRDPSKLTKIFDPTPSNLKIVQGNAHDATAVASCIQLQAADSSTMFVDKIVSTIGGKFKMSSFTLDDPNVCEKGMKALLEAIQKLRQQGVQGRPHIMVGSTTGMSHFGRDIPITVIPLYYILLPVPHADKRKMEDLLSKSGEVFTIVRASWLVDGERGNTIRVGIEDPTNGIEKLIIGYTISREDAGKWIANNLVPNIVEPGYINKTVTITY